MPFDLSERLVVAVASSALFDLADADEIFRANGLDAYRRYQRDHEHDALAPGVALPFVRRLLALNDPADAPVEVILVSRNDPDTGARVFNSIAAHGLPITRAAFLGGGEPYAYMTAFQVSLFLSADERSVRDALDRGYPAAQVLGAGPADDPAGSGLRVAFDFDGVLVDDEAERVFARDGLEGFNRAEAAAASRRHVAGPLAPLFRGLGRLQARETAAGRSHRLRTAIVTSRGAPAHARMITTLREWGVRVDETFLLGGIEKNAVLAAFRPHLFFDDQLTHAGPASSVVPAVHVPFGVRNGRRRVARPVEYDGES